MGRKLEGFSVPFLGREAGYPSITIWPGPRPTCVPSFVLIRPTVWPQYTNVTDRTDRQTDRQRTDSIGRTVLQTVAPKVILMSCKTSVYSTANRLNFIVNVKFQLKFTNNGFRRHSRFKSTTANLHSLCTPKDISPCIRLALRRRPAQRCIRRFHQYKSRTECFVRRPT